MTDTIRLSGAIGIIALLKHVLKEKKTLIILKELGGKVSRICEWDQSYHLCLGDIGESVT